MSEYDDRQAIISGQAAERLMEVLRTGTPEEFSAAFTLAAATEARSFEKSKRLLTLSAVFLIDYVGVIVTKLEANRIKIVANLLLNDQATLEALKTAESGLAVITRLRNHFDMPDKGSWTIALGRAGFAPGYAARLFAGED